MKRRWLILTGVLALAAGGAVAAVVLIASGDDEQTGLKAAPAARRLSLPLAERLGGFISGPATAPSSRSAAPAAPGRPQVRVESELNTARLEAYALRAYPQNRVTLARAQAARKSFNALPLRLTSAAAPNAKSKLQLTAGWQLLGPTRAKSLPYEFTNLPNRPTIVSGRVVAIAVVPGCSVRRCRVYVGSAGGGVFRTDNALALVPVWRAVSDGLTSIAIGALALDPRDRTGNTLYAGTGDSSSSTDAEAGLGVFKTTDGGASWSLLAGSDRFARDRAVSDLVLDPRRPGTIYFSTTASVHGSSAVAGGFGAPPGTAPLGVYRSTDGGKTFSMFFKSPIQQDWSGVTDMALDPNAPDAVFASVSGIGPGNGLYRSSKRADGDTAFHLMFRAKNPSHYGYSFVRFAVADLGKRTRIYMTDSDPVANPDRQENPQGVAHVYRLDDAAVRATAALAAGRGWRKLSSNSITKPGYGAFRYCQVQCDYSNTVASPPGKPNHVWLGGTFDYPDENYHQRDWNNGRAAIRSTDGGLTWNDMTADTQAPAYMMHPDLHVVAFSPDDPNIAFVGSDGGVVRTSASYTDRSRACSTRGLTPQELRQCRRMLRSIPTRIFSLNKNLPTLQFQSVSVSPPGQPLELLGGTQDNGTWAYSAKGGWSNAAGGDGGQSVVGKGGAIHIHTYHGPILRVNYSRFDPKSWRYIFPPLVASGERASFYVPLLADPVTAGVLFVGLQHVWRTTQYGGDRKVLDADCDGFIRLEATCGGWRAIGQDLTGPAFGTDRGGDDQRNFVAAIARAPSDTSTVWAATTPGRVFVSENADAAAPASVTFKRVDLPTTASRKGTPGRFVSGLAVDSSDPLHAWVAYSGYDAYTPNDQTGHVFEVRFDPTTGKATWTNRSYDLGDQPVIGLERDTKTGDLYAATDFGVVRLPNGATSWTEAARGLPYVSVYGLTMAPDGSTLYAATHGRGVWQLALR